jgi:hypothetical protein
MGLNKMKTSTIFRITLFAALVLILGPLTLWPDTDCPGCDCVFPINNSECVKCCLFLPGTVASATDTSVTLVPSSGAGNSKPTTFKLKKGTKVNGKLKEGTKATVYYRVTDGQNVASQIDAVDYLSGQLVPAPETGTPIPGPCQNGVPPGALRVLLGGRGGVDTYSSSDRAIVNVGGEDLIALQRTARGVLVTAKILNSTGQVVAYIVDNHFFVNMRDSYHIKMPSDHLLIVNNAGGDTVFSIEFLNPQTVRILGTLFGPRGERILMGEDQTIIGGGAHFSGICLGGTSSHLINVD